MDPQELKRILEDHQNWLQDNGGKQADLSRADLSWADLSRANLVGANLSWADLSRANLVGADLSWANLVGADLSRADLSRANLVGADLVGTKIEFPLFPSIGLLSSMPLGELSDKLTLELMRRDAYAHPYPEKFDEWAKGGNCPYKDEETFWQFKTKRKLWRRGKPQMADRDLILAICNEKSWGIRGHLQAEAWT